MLLIFILSSITLIFLFYLILLFLFDRPAYINRIEEFSEIIPVEIKKIKKTKGTVLYSVANKLPKLKRNRKKIERDLKSANLNMSVEELLMYKIILSFIITFIIYIIKSDYFLTGISFVLVWRIPKVWINKRIRNRITDFNEQLNSGLILISNSLKAGHSFLQAISISAKETQGVFSDEFKILLKELNFGITMEQGLLNLLDRVNSADMKLVVNAILIQKDIGGNLSEILENISETIRERQKIKNEMKTLTSQGKMSGTIVTLLPVFLGGVIYLINKEYIMLLFTTKIGMAMLLASVVSEIIGILLIKKIITVEV